MHQWDILSPGRKWDNLSDGTICLWGESGTFCLMGQFVSLKTPLGQFVLGTKCLLTLDDYNGDVETNIMQCWRGRRVDTEEQLVVIGHCQVSE